MEPLLTITIQKILRSYQLAHFLKINVPDDIVHLFNAEKTLHHYAISIGQNYYLSLFGRTGTLIVSTLDAVKKGFSSDICVQALKKKMMKLNRLVHDIKIQMKTATFLYLLIYSNKKLVLHLQTILTKYKHRSNPIRRLHHNFRC